MLNHLSVAIALFLALGSTASAQDSAEKRLDKLEADYAELKRQLLEQQKQRERHNPFENMHFHGYGEVHFNGPGTSSTATRGTDEIDFHRMVFGWEYEFSESIRVDAEVDFEHAAKEVELEYAHLEVDLTHNLSARIGYMLMPVGPLNEFHEPPNYFSVERPYLETYVIPTSWSEFGVGISGQTDDSSVRYRLYVVNGLNATGFTATEGIREGRGLEGVDKARAEDFAVVGRIENTVWNSESTNGARRLGIGASGYYGGADQSISGVGRVTVGIWEADANLRVDNIEIKGEIAGVRVTNADSISGTVGETVGREMQGWLAEAAYHFGSIGLQSNSEDLVLFARREMVQTNLSAPGFAKDPAADRGIWTFGAAYYPERRLTFKLDYEHWRDNAGDRLGRVSFGVGWMF